MHTSSLPTQLVQKSLNIMWKHNNLIETSRFYKLNVCRDTSTIVSPPCVLQKFEELSQQTKIQSITQYKNSCCYD